MNTAVSIFPTITAISAIFAAGLHAFLSLRVSLIRNASGIPFGVAGDERLRARVRAHGNFAENAPLFLVLLGISEMAGAVPEILWFLAGLFAVARTAHAAGLEADQPRNPGRLLGGMLTLWCHVGAATLLAHSVVLWLSL